MLKSNIRISLERELIPSLKKYTKGKTLEIGVGNLSYKKYANYSSYKSLDINSKLNVDFCEDIHKTTIRSNSFDTVFMIEVLEHLYNPFEAIRQVRRILKKGGRVIATTPFIYPYHSEPYDYFRYTKHGLKRIFKGFDEIKIIEYGNVLGAILDILTAYKIFKPFRVLNF